MVMKNDGREKPKKMIKCNCKKRFDIHDGEMIKNSKGKFVICPYCGIENKVK